MVAFKILSIVIALGALAFFVLRSLRGEAGPGQAGRGGLRMRAAPARASDSMELVPCERCGAYRPAGPLCPCQTAPTP